MISSLTDACLDDDNSAFADDVKFATVVGSNSGADDVVVQD